MLINYNHNRLIKLVICRETYTNSGSTNDGNTLDFISQKSGQSKKLNELVGFYTNNKMISNWNQNPI